MANSAGVLACYLAALGYGAAQPPVADSEQAIVPWLEAHHLTTGLGTYNEANLITVDSGGRVAIRTVSWQFNRNVPRSFESNADWFDPRHNYANFIVTNTADTTPNRDRSLRRSSMIPARRCVCWSVWSSAISFSILSAVAMLRCSRGRTA